MIDRRAVLASIAGAAAMSALPAEAQKLKRLPVVAYVAAAPPLAEIVGSDPSQPLARAFVHGLRDLGWIDGHNVVIERRTAEGEPQRAPVIFAELLSHGVDVIVLAGGRWLPDAAQQATRTTPTVALFSADPVAGGLIKSLPRPGGNLTGVTVTTGSEFQSKRLQLLAELAPSVARVAFLGTRDALEQDRDLARPAGVVVVPVQVETAEQYDVAFATILRERVDALMVAAGPVAYNNVARVVAFAAGGFLPAVYPWREAVDAGGLMSYGTNVPGTFRQAARQVDKILKGAWPGDIPTEQPTKFELVINARAAKALGLTIPPTLLAFATEVIE